MWMDLKKKQQYNRNDNNNGVKTQGVESCDVSDHWLVNWQGGGPHLEESCESRGSSRLPSAPPSSSSSCRSPFPDPPSPRWEPDGPGRGAPEESVGHPGASEGVAVCIIFCRTSRIFSCRQSLVGKMSEYLVWKAAVAGAARRHRDKHSH